MSLVDVHDRLANSALLYAVFLGVWGFIQFFRGRGLSSSFWGALVVAEILILVQGALGGYLWLVGFRPDRVIHLLYGVTAALAIPAAFAFTRGRETRREMLIYAAVLLFMGGLLLRASGTG